MSDAIEATLSIKDVAQRLPDPALFAGLSAGEADQWASYLYARPRPQTRRLSPRSHMVSLYDPFAARKDFAAGRRWCVNVYTGCAFRCKYCYTVCYIKDAFRPRVKERSRRLLLKDLSELRGRALHPAPVHISNSTDPLQPLEGAHQHTLFLLQQIQENHDLFTRITILTKNPGMLCAPEYLETLRNLGGVQVAVTCLFFRDEAWRYYEPGAPSVASRLEGIPTLRETGVPVSLRIDPVLPRDPLPRDLFGKASLQDYGIPESQTAADIEQLIRFASDAGCQRIIAEGPAQTGRGTLRQIAVAGGFSAALHGCEQGQTHQERHGISPPVGPIPSLDSSAGRAGPVAGHRDHLLQKESRDDQ